MIEVNRARLEAAVRAGSHYGGEWRLCRKDGLVYWQSAFCVTPHETHESLRVPVLYPDGRYTEYLLFLFWAKKLPSRRADHILALVRGTRSRENEEGTAFAVPCIVSRFLTGSECAAWHAHVEDRVTLYVESCLAALNANGGRLRYRWLYPSVS